jgi:hypothetical protein
MADEPKESTPAQPNVVAVEPPAGVDLSDLQAEMDAEANKKAEDDVFAEITGTEDTKSEEDEDKEEVEGKEGATDEDEEEKAEGAEGDKPKKSRAQRYRDVITRLEQEVAELRSQTGGSLSKAAIAERAEEEVGPEPKEADFDNYLEYERKHIAWDVQKQQAIRDIERANKVHVEARNRKIQENVERHKEAVAAFRTRNGEVSAKDFDEVMAKAKDLSVAPHVEYMILDSGKSAHLQYFFARNPSRLDKINRMSAVEAAREIGHIEARLFLPQAKTRTAAPEPVRPPRGGASPASQEADLNSWLAKKYGSQ